MAVDKKVRAACMRAQHVSTRICAGRSHSSSVRVHQGGSANCPKHPPPPGPPPPWWYQVLDGQLRLVLLRGPLGGCVITSDFPLSALEDTLAAFCRP